MLSTRCGGSGGFGEVSLSLLLTGLILAGSVGRLVVSG